MPSTVIAGSNYDHKKRELIITFRSDEKYAYINVPETINDAFRSAFSKGIYFNQYIKGTYTFRHITKNGKSSSAK